MDKNEKIHSESEVSMKRVTKKRNIIKVILLEQKEIFDNRKAKIKNLK